MPYENTERTLRQFYSTTRGAACDLLTKGEDYQWARPALVADKTRAMQLQVFSFAVCGRSLGRPSARFLRCSAGSWSSGRPEPSLAISIPRRAHSPHASIANMFALPQSLLTAEKRRRVVMRGPRQRCKVEQTRWGAKQKEIANREMSTSIRANGRYFVHILLATTRSWNALSTTALQLSRCTNDDPAV